MPEPKAATAKKAEGQLDPEKKGNETSASEAEGEVQGHTVFNINVHCPWCGSHRVVDLDYEGQWFDCGSCGKPYQVFY
jgi:transposase-like protein